jgi:transglutaminase-like putative cysteine protease
VGTVRYLDPRGYAANYAVSIAAAGAAGGVDLYLWIPAIPETPAQRHVAEPSVNERPIQRDPAGVGLFRFPDPVSGVSREVRSDYRIRRYAIQTTIEPSSVRGYRTDSAFHERFTGGDAVVPSGGNLPAIAERAMQGYVNPLWRARLTFDYVVARLQPVAAAGARIAPAGTGPMQVVAAAIDERRAAPYEYALTFSAVARAAGIPARPVAGYLIDDSARAVPHYWAEFYLQDFGWVPVDPAMEAGAALLAWHTDDAAVDPWFGTLDSRRIVMAKGISDPQPIARARRLQRPEVPGLQTAHEDVVGATSEYRTNWLGLTVTDRF